MSRLGTPEALARVVAGTSHLYTLLPIIEASDVTGQDPARVASAYFAVGGALDLTWYLQQITSLPVDNNWQGLAREAFRDDLDWQQRAITVSLLQMVDAPEDIEARTALWLEQHASSGCSLARHAGRVARRYQRRLRHVCSGRS